MKYYVTFGNIFLFSCKNGTTIKNVRQYFLRPYYIITWYSICTTIIPHFPQVDHQPPAMHTLPSCSHPSELSSSQLWSSLHARWLASSQSPVSRGVPQLLLVPPWPTSVFGRIQISHLMLKDFNRQGLISRSKELVLKKSI